MLHNRYRKAKKFKLDDDLEVVDEFSGGRRSHGQARWRENHMGRKWSRKMKRYLRSRVGHNWDDVFSDFCQAAKLEGSYGEYCLRDRLSRVERSVYMIDGYPHELNTWRYAAEAYRPLWKDTLYVDPTTKLLCVAEGLKQEPKPSSFPPPDKTVEAGEKFNHGGLSCKGTYFVHKSSTYNRRVGCGVVEPVVEKVWFKHSPYVYEWAGSSWKRIDGEWVRVYAPCSEVRYKITTASKREIKQHKLNNEGS